MDKSFRSDSTHENKDNAWQEMKLRGARGRHI